MDKPEGSNSTAQEATSSIIERRSLSPDPSVLSNKEVVDRIYTVYVLYTAYNNLVRDFPELGWLSKHNDASRELYERFENIRITLNEARINPSRALMFRFGSPVIKEAIVDVELEFLRNDIVTADQALPFIGALLKRHPALTGLEKKVSAYRSSILVPRVRIVRRRVKPLKVPGAA